MVDWLTILMVVLLLCFKNSLLFIILSEQNTSFLRGKFYKFFTKTQGIQCHIVKNTLAQTPFSAILPMIQWVYV